MDTYFSKPRFACCEKMVIHDVKLRMNMIKSRITLCLIVLLALTASCAKLQPYRYAYKSPTSMKMTELKKGNRKECRKLFPPGGYIQLGPAVQIPTNASTFGHFIAVHGDDATASTIYKWRSDDGKLWYVFDPPGPESQLWAHSATDFVLKLEQRFAK